MVFNLLMFIIGPRWFSSYPFYFVHPHYRPLDWALSLSPQMRADKKVIVGLKNRMHFATYLHRIFDNKEKLYNK